MMGTVNSRVGRPAPLALSRKGQVILRGRRGRGGREVAEGLGGGVGAALSRLFPRACPPGARWPLSPAGRARAAVPPPCPPPTRPSALLPRVRPVGGRPGPHLAGPVAAGAGHTAGAGARVRDLREVSVASGSLGWRPAPRPRGCHAAPPSAAAAGSTALLSAARPPQPRGHQEPRPQGGILGPPLPPSCPGAPVRGAARLAGAYHTRVPTASHHAQTPPSVSFGTCL